MDKEISEKPLEVLVIAGDLVPEDLGGAEMHIVEVIKGLARKGYILHVFVGNDTRAKALFQEGRVHVHAVRYPRIKNLYSLAYILWGTPQLSRFLRKNIVHLIHAKEIFPMGVMGARLRQRFRVPLYLTIQNPLGYKEELVVKGYKFVQTIGNKLREIIRPLLRYSLQRADTIAAVSQHSADRASLFTANPIHIVPNGVELTKFTPSKTQKPPHPVVVTTSTLIPRNGVDILLQAFALFLQHHPDAELKIAGEGPLKKELDQLVEKLGIETSVQWLGTRSQDQIPPLLHEAHLFVRPSRFEGFGVSFLEAMACGVPVITCPSGGILDFVKDHETGILIPVNDPKALAKAMKEVYESQELSDHLIHQARALVEQQYGWSSIVNQVEHLYRATLHSSS